MRQPRPRARIWAVLAVIAWAIVAYLATHTVKNLEVKSEIVHSLRSTTA